MKSLHLGLLIIAIAIVLSILAFLIFGLDALLWMIMLIVNMSLIMIMYRIFGKTGLFAWIPIAAIIANIQVLKEVNFLGFPTTLGNIVYASSFLVTDILSENYGKKDAQRAVYLGFFALIAGALLMNLALQFTPSENDWAQASLQDVFGFFAPIAIASFCAYGISQLHDVWAYSFWKKFQPKIKFIWLRNNASTLVSQLIDTLVFHSMAIVLGAGDPFNWDNFIFLSITVYVVKVIVAASDTGLVYLASMWKRDKVVQ